MNWTSYLYGLATLPVVAAVGWWLLGVIDRCGWSRRHFVWHDGVQVRPLLVSITPTCLMLVGRSGWAVWLERRRLHLPLPSLGWPAPCQPRDGWPMRWAILGRVHVHPPLLPDHRVIRRRDR